MKKEYITAMETGKEIVIISAEKELNSAIFWKKSGTYFCFTREFGVMRRTDLDDEKVSCHLAEMLKESAQIIIRG